jgi:hypothetical protein
VSIPAPPGAPRTSRRAPVAQGYGSSTSASKIMNPQLAIAPAITPG